MTSAMIGYKIAKNSAGKRVVVTLEIPKDAKTNLGRSDVVVRETATYRTNKARVLKIEDAAGRECMSATSFCYTGGRSLKYLVGHDVIDPRYVENPEEVCAPGIHFFLTRRVAELYGLNSFRDRLYQQWHDNGQLAVEEQYIGIRRHGIARQWHANGQLREEATFVDGLLNGRYQQWHENGCRALEATCVEGVFHGRVQRWYANGRKADETPYVSGVRHGIYHYWLPNGQKSWEARFEDGFLQAINSVPIEFSPL